MLFIFLKIVAFFLYFKTLNNLNLSLPLHLRYQFSEMMTCTLSCDHRVVDGAVRTHTNIIYREPVDAIGHLLCMVVMSKLGTHTLKNLFSTNTGGSSMARSIQGLPGGINSRVCAFWYYIIICIFKCWIQIYYFFFVLL